MAVWKCPWAASKIARWWPRKALGHQWPSSVAAQFGMAANTRMTVSESTHDLAKRASIRHKVVTSWNPDADAALAEVDDSAA